MNEEPKHVLIYTDGACDPNPGPGGLGIVLIHGEHRKEISGGFRLTTNNRMEIYAAIKGLEALKNPCKVTLYSDSEYLVKAMTEGWVRRWKDKDWWRNKRERAVNVDLWERLLSLCETHAIEFVWVKGHAGHLENERCDWLSYHVLNQSDLPADEGYEGRPTDGGVPAKITESGQPCRKCGTPVVKKRPRSRPKPGHAYFEYYLFCPNCGTTYTVEEAKRTSEEEPKLF